MAQHTPGPWTHYDDSNDSTRRHEIAAHGKTVARVYCTKGHEDADRDNARLIAAAPDLLAFAEWIARQGSHLSDDEVREIYNSLDAENVLRARAAIAKAKGDA